MSLHLSAHTKDFYDLLAGRISLEEYRRREPAPRQRRELVMVQMFVLLGVYAVVHSAFRQLGNPHTFLILYYVGLLFPAVYVGYRYLLRAELVPVEAALIYRLTNRTERCREDFEPLVRHGTTASFIAGLIDENAYREGIQRLAVKGGYLAGLTSALLCLLLVRAPDVQPFDAFMGVLLSTAVPGTVVGVALYYFLLAPHCERVIACLREREQHIGAATQSQGAGTSGS